jgi:carbon monoxide dehydrogenase subunit G
LQLENSFSVAAPPERVFAYLLDVNKVVGCVPGAELSEVVDPTTFKGKVKIKVGPVTVAYSGTARIVDRNDSAHTATLEAEGRETTGPGSARAKAFMSVVPEGEASVVKIVTDYNVAGRVAQFGRGVMEDVSKRLVVQMADCIKANVEAAEPGDGGAGGAPSAEDGGTGGGLVAGSGGAGAGPGAAARSAASAQAATVRPINAMSLLFSVLWARLTGARPTGETLPMEPMDTGTAGIGVMLGVSSVISIALAAIVVVSALNEIFKTS